MNRGENREVMGGVRGGCGDVNKHKCDVADKVKLYYCITES